MWQCKWRNMLNKRAFIDDRGSLKSSQSRSMIWSISRSHPQPAFNFPPFLLSVLSVHVNLQRLPQARRSTTQCPGGGQALTIMAACPTAMDCPQCYVLFKLSINGFSFRVLKDKKSPLLPEKFSMSLLDIERNNTILCHCLQPGKEDSNSDTAIGFAYFQTPLII